MNITTTHGQDCSQTTNVDLHPLSAIAAAVWIEAELEQQRCGCARRSSATV